MRRSKLELYHFVPKYQLWATFGMVYTMKYTLGVQYQRMQTKASYILHTFSLLERLKTSCSNLKCGNTYINVVLALAYSLICRFYIKPLLRPFYISLHAIPYSFFKHTFVFLWYAVLSGSSVSLVAHSVHHLVS